ETKVDRIEFDPDKWLIAKADIVNAVEDVSENRNIQIISERESKSVRVLLPDNYGEGKLRIVDLTGRVVKNFDLSESDSRIAISDLKGGIYLVEVQVGTLKKSEKILLSPFKAE
ncbi:MAG: T9SS type A sorting domain-containing protein, partial [Sulfuricurvum sp.]|nr:T9SS type A sorting domain-containing protein [Sulfuricurvum sp.]